jgi:uncharacterized protein (DUF1778 family)
MARHAIKRKSDVERLEVRISADKKRLLKNVADLLGQTLADFVINSACEAAVRIIQEYPQLRLSVNDRDIFIQVLLNSPEPSSRLLKATKVYKKEIISK